jgi:hypothetical protein
MDLRELAITPSHSGRHPWELARADAVVHCLRESSAKPLRILDIGCGDLYVAKRLVAAFEVDELIAVDSSLTPQVRERVGLPKESPIVLFQSLEQAEAKESSPHPVDFVLLLDVLEHCEDDSQLLKQLKASRWVGEQTQFLITVPAGPRLFSRYDTFLGHFRRYSLKALRRSVSEAGMGVSSGHYFFSCLVIPRAIQVAFEKIGLSKRPPKGLAAYTSKDALDPAIRFLLWVDFRICRFLSYWKIKPFGLSCLVIAKSSP